MGIFGGVLGFLRGACFCDFSVGLVFLAGVLGVVYFA